MLGIFDLTGQITPGDVEARVGELFDCQTVGREIATLDPLPSWMEFRSERTRDTLRLPPGIDASGSPYRYYQIPESGGAPRPFIDRNLSFLREQNRVGADRLRVDRDRLIIRSVPCPPP